MTCQKSIAFLANVPRYTHSKDAACCSLDFILGYPTSGRHKTTQDQTHPNRTVSGTSTCKFMMSSVYVCVWLPPISVVIKRIIMQTVYTKHFLSVHTRTHALTYTHAHTCTRAHTHTQVTCSCIGSHMQYKSKGAMQGFLSKQACAGSDRFFFVFCFLLKACIHVLMKWSK